MDTYNKIAEISLELFSKLPKTGKPTEKQWTILSTIVKENTQTNTTEVVALGTGTKCIGMNQMSSTGDIINDSHAEIVCRRSFLKYLYFEIKSCIENNYENDLVEFHIETVKFTVKNHFIFHFFTTHVPCGDGSIFLKDNTNNLKLQVDNTKHSIESTLQNVPKKIKLDNEIVADINRTGAKCLSDGSLFDPHKVGINYHVVGPIRTKPGRGDPTLSVSCSDKIAKWCYLGIQGSLLSFFLNLPIYLNSFTVAGNSIYSKYALERALLSRFEEIPLCEPFKKHSLLIQQSNVDFEFQKTDDKIPCPSSISWWKNIRKVEICIDGKKQGVIKKMKNSKISRLGICKIELMRNFMEIVEMMGIKNIPKEISYNELKLLSSNYQIAWNILKRDIFKVYVSKDPKLLCFTLD